MSKINYIGFGFCVGMAVASAVSGRWDIATIQVLGALLNVPGMFI